MNLLFLSLGFLLLSSHSLTFILDMIGTEEYCFPTIMSDIGVEHKTIKMKYYVSAMDDEAGVDIKVLR